MADAGKVVNGILWFLILWFIAFPVAGFCAGWYILLMPFTVCFDGLTVNDVIRLQNNPCIAMKKTAK